MKTKDTLLAVAAIIMAAELTSNAQTTTVNFALTVTYEPPAVISGSDQNITTTVMKTAKITSSSIIKLVENAEDIQVPGGSYLAQDSGSPEILYKNGDSVDLSPYLTIDDSTAASVGGGSDNSDTGKETATGYVFTIIAFDDGNGNSFTLDGLLKTSISVSVANSSGVQTETGSFSGPVLGYGTIVDSQGNTDYAVFSGTFSGSGKGPAGS